MAIPIPIQIEYALWHLHNNPPPLGERQTKHKHRHKTLFIGTCRECLKYPKAKLASGGYTGRKWGWGHHHHHCEVIKSSG